MPKTYFAKHPNGNITQCNFPIKETNAESFAFNVSTPDLEAIKEEEKEITISEEGKLEIKASNKKAKRLAAIEEKKEAKEALKEKLSKKTATLEEVQEALLKLL